MHDVLEDESAEILSLTRRKGNIVDDTHRLMGDGKVDMEVRLR